MKRIVFTILIVMAFVPVSHAQEACQYIPADCPETGDIEAVKDSNACIANLIVGQEITMQNILREKVTQIVQQTAEKKGWQWYELTESSGRGIGIEGNTKPLPYALRPPFEYTISFEFIVNKDSLEAWRNWMNNEQRNMSEETVNSYKQVDNSSAQQFQDSATYYSKQMTTYMTDHYAEYQKAIMANDQGGIKKYDAAIKKYQDKIDYFINKQNAKRDENYSAADNQYKNLETTTKGKKAAYRNASILRVTFYFNNYTTRETDNSKIIKSLPVPSSSLANLFHNNSPDETNRLSTYLRSPDYAFVLFGKWNIKLNQYNAYDAVFRFDKNANDIVSVKKIPSDKVRTILVTIEGTPGNITIFSNMFNWQMLNSVVVKE